MTGIEKIIARLEAEAQAEQEALRAETEARNQALLADCREKAEAIYEAELRAGKAACALQGERLQSAAEMESKKLLLGCKQELVSGVFEHAVERLSHMAPGSPEIGRKDARITAPTRTSPTSI